MNKLEFGDLFRFHIRGQDYINLGITTYEVIKACCGFHLDVFHEYELVLIYHLAESRFRYSSVDHMKDVILISYFRDSV